MNYEQTLCAYTDEVRREGGRVQKRAWFVGVSMLITLPLQILLSMLCGPTILQAEKAIDESMLARLLYFAMYGGYYCAMVLLPVLLCALLFRVSPRLPQVERRRVGALEGTLVVLFGLGFCVLANYVTNYWLIFAEQFGVQPYQGDYHSKAGVVPLLFNVVIYAVLPAVVEELVFRGWFISALQPAGERCALIASALLFGLAHGNLTQMPFAFMLGLLFGWLFLRTGRLWPSMLVHFLNNAMAVFFDAAGTFLAEGDHRVMQMTVWAGIVLVGAIAAVLLAVHPACRTMSRPLCDRRGVLAVRRRRRIVMLNPAVILSVLAYGGLMLLKELAR